MTCILSSESLSFLFIVSNAFLQSKVPKLISVLLFLQIFALWAGLLLAIGVFINFFPLPAPLQNANSICPCICTQMHLQLSQFMATVPVFHLYDLARAHTLGFQFPSYCFSWVRCVCFSLMTKVSLYCDIPKQASFAVSLETVHRIIATVTSYLTSLSLFFF